MSHPHPARRRSDFDPEIRRATHIFFLLCVVMCLAIGVWAAYSPLPIISIVEGEVVPSSQIKEIQHLEGGIVEKILVAEGEQVVQGQPLVELASIANDADLEELKIRLLALDVEIARLQAEEKGVNKITFPKKLLQNAQNSHLLEQGRALFATRRRGLEDSLAVQEQVVAQRRIDGEEITNRIINQKKRRTLLQEQIKISKAMLEDDLSNRYAHIDLLTSLNRLQSKIDDDTAALNRSKAALAEAKMQTKAIQSNYNEEVATALEGARRMKNEFSARLGKYTDSQSRTILRAPVAGEIKTLNVVTEGGVIPPGGVVLDMVPGGDSLVVEAKLPTQDVGYIQIGQTAVLRLASMDARRFGEINGKVIRISPDTLDTKEGRPYYKIRIAIGERVFNKKGNLYRLQPGLILNVSIHTGERTVMEYLFSPYLNAMDSAMAEQ